MPPTAPIGAEEVSEMGAAGPDVARDGITWSDRQCRTMRSDRETTERTGPVTSATDRRLETRAVAGDIDKLADRLIEIESDLLKRALERVGELSTEMTNLKEL